MAGENLTPLMLIDRACTGGFEFMYDHVPQVFRRGAVEKIGTVDLATFVFSHQHTCVWTKDGEFVNRLAVKDAPGFEGVAKALAQRLGDEILDQTPIEIDTNPRRIEGWSLEGADRQPGRTAVESVSVPSMELRENLSTAGSRLSHKER